MRRALWALTAMLGLALSACGSPAVSSSASVDVSTPSASETGAPEASATATATATATVTASAPAAEPSTSTASVARFPIDALVEVTVSDLVVRSAPGVDVSTSTILDGRLTLGDRAYVVDGPMEADGYAWYEVGPLLRSDGSAAPFGWIAVASRDGEAWVRATEPTCPTIVDILPIIDMQPLERLACYGDMQLALSAPLVTCGAGGGPISFEPSWLVSIGGCGLTEDVSGGSALAYRVPPGVPDPGVSGGPTTVVGHFDDPAASTCTATSADPSKPAPGPDEAVLICRTQFVAERS